MITDSHTICSKLFKVEYETLMQSGEKFTRTMEIEAFSQEGVEFQFFYRLERNKLIRSNSIKNISIVN